MTQEEGWLKNYHEVVAFIESNKRNPSKYKDAERGLRNWVRHQQKLVNKGELKEERMEKFNVLLALAERYRRKNQWE